MTARSFLVRGLLAGLLAGIVAFAVGYVVGEPALNASIALESTTAGHGAGTVPHEHEGDAQPHSHAAGSTDAAVPRPLQSTAGLLTGTVAAGVTLGGLIGVLSALALGRFGALGPRATTLFVAAAGFVTLYVVPSWAFPPTPPGGASGDTIGYRTAQYFILMAISVLALVVVVLVGRRLATRWGGWYATLAAGLAYLAIVSVAIALLPVADEVPADFPAALLFEFRRASFVTQLALWTTLGVVLADLVGRLSEQARPAPRSTSLPSELR